MKPDISALLDDELDQGEANRMIDALRRNGDLLDAWNTYHLIGDSLRGTQACSKDFTEKVMGRLAEEPILFAPAVHHRIEQSPFRFAFPLAAAVMGMAAVGWVALSLNAPQPTQLAANQVLPKDQKAAAVEQSASGGLKEYLVAHQAHSQAGGIQGVAPYMRTVSEIHQGGRP